MGTQPYHLKDGSRVPGTTTVISAVKLGSIEGLLVWANKLGKEGKDHREVRDAAANAGTACHEMAECYFHGTEFNRSQYTPDILEKADGAYKAFIEWTEQTKLQIVAAEVPLVSEQYRYGGTLDAMLVNGRLSLGDWKTSNSLNTGMLCQLAAYRQLWDENNPANPIVGGFHLLRFSKPEHKDDPVHFSHHYWDQLDAAWETFKHMRELYDIHKRLLKLV